MPKIHHYHPSTFIYTHSQEALPDPMDEGRWQVPAFSTMKTPNKERDGLVNQYSEAAKGFVLVEPPVAASEQAPKEKTVWDSWMVPIDDRPAHIRSTGATLCSAVCGALGYASAEHLEAEAAKNDTSPLGKRAKVMNEWRINVIGFCAQLAADVRNGNTPYPASKRDFLMLLPTKPADPVEIAEKYGADYEFE